MISFIYYNADIIIKNKTNTDRLDNNSDKAIFIKNNFIVVPTLILRIT